MTRLGRLGCLLLAGVLAACAPSGPPTIERLRLAVAVYAQGKPQPTEQQVDALFAQVDADVAALRADAADGSDDARSRAETLQRERTELWGTYVKAKVERLRRTAEGALRDLGKQVGQQIEDAGRQVQESMERP
jgi:hypothetical protein